MLFFEILKALYTVACILLEGGCLFLWGFD